MKYLFFFFLCFVCVFVGFQLKKPVVINFGKSHQ